MAVKLCFAALLCLTVAATASQSEKPSGKTWLLLIASAKGWFNYGMQADVYHAYQIAKEGGIPEEQIILMAFDDIAQNAQNPFKGEVFQSYDLKDVYKDVKIDYSGNEISKKSFLAVLTGDKKGVKQLTGRDGKVVESGKDDTVFVFVSDHGGPGVICFFDFHDLTAKELNDTITSMHEKQRYKNMIFYVDTCYAGSMFEDILSPDIGVYAATASNKTSFAYSDDCESLAFPDESVPCLGGLFSINWVYETESDERKKATLDQQFQEAKIACRGLSTSKQYGDLSIANLPQATVFGDSATNKRKPSGHRRSRRSAGGPHAVPKHLMSYYMQKKRLDNLPAESEEARRAADQLQGTTTLMSQADEFMKAIATAIYGRFHTDSKLEAAKTNFGKIDWACYDPVLKAVSAHCPGLSYREEVRYYAMSQFGILINLCNEVPTDTVLAAVKNAAQATPLCQL